MALAVVIKMKFKYFIAVILLISVLLPASATYVVSAQGSSAQPSFSSYLSSAVSSINMTQIKAYAEKLSSFQSRVTGYPGNIEAAKYIEGVLRADGLTVINQSFTSAVPVDTGSWVYIPAMGSNYTVYALWPNGPVPGGTPTFTSGRLVYVGNGSLGDMDGKVIDGSIVLENFNSGDNWLYAAELGAKAIIFLAPSETTSLQSRLKANVDPLYMPRVYASGQAAQALLKAAESGETVEVHDGMKWENVTSYNVIGIINGTTSKNIIIASAHYDSWSVVPALAPGGQDALGISTLLDLAGYLAQHRPYRTVWIVAYSGYWEGLVGPYAFVHKYLYSPENLNGAEKIWMDIDLDFSSESPSLDGLYYGFFNGYSLGGYAVTKYQGYLEPTVDKFFAAAGINNTTPLGLPAVTFYMHGAEDWGTQPSLYMLDVEPIVQTNTLAFTLRTSFATRNTWLTPINNLNLTNWANVYQQAKTAALIISGFADIPQLGISWSSDAPGIMGSNPGGNYGFVTVVVRTVQFSPNTSWYVPVPDSLVQVPRGPSGNPDWWMFGSQWYFTNRNGTMSYYGAIPYWGWTFLAWKINGSSGQLDYAVNYGIYGTAHGVSGGLNTYIPFIVSQPSYVSVPMFEAEPVTAFNIIDPRTMSPAAIYDPRNTYMSFFSEPAVMSVYKETTRATPIYWGLSYTPSDTLATAFVQKRENIVLTYNPNPTQVGPLIVLDNASSVDQRGYGYQVQAPLTLTDTFFLEARDMYFLVQERYARLSAHFATSPGLVVLMSKAKVYLDYAQGNLTELNYSAAYNDSMVSLAYSSQAYDTQLMPMYGQISGSMIFFSFLIIPFGYFFEEYVFHFRGLKRIIAMFAIIIALIYVFSVINPALSVISNSTMTVLGVGLLIFALFVAWVFYGEIKEMLAAGARSRLGIHEITGSTVAASTHSAATAVENMRRRPLMSALTLLTIVIFAAGNVALTSTSSGLGLAKSPVSSSTMPKVEGILVKWYYGMPPEIMGGQMLNYLAGIGGAAFNYWPTYLYYPTFMYQFDFNGSVKSEVIVMPVQLVGTNNVTVMQNAAFMGIAPGEAGAFFSKYVVGSTNISSDSVIIPQSLALALGAKVGQRVDFYGVGTFKVAGILLPNATVSGFDGYSIYPINPYYNSAADEGFSSPYSSSTIPEASSPSEVIIMDWTTVKQLGGFLSNVVMVPKSNMSYGRLLAFASTIRYPVTPSVYVSRGDGSSLGLSVVATYSFMGFSLTLILLIIAALAILNAMYENVQIRRREIQTYASLGLSPSGATMMFITEALVYALIGAVLGFLLGFGLDFTFISLHVLPSGFTFNFTSWSMLLALLMIIVATLGGSIYPSRVSSKLITPSLTRRWKPTSKAKGKEWNMELPMKLLHQEETLGVLRYLKEYYYGLGYEKPNFRVESEPLLDEAEGKLTVRVRLSPFEMGLVQDAIFDFVQTPTFEYVLYLTLKLVAGDPGLWQARNEPFLDDVRAQVLLWRSLTPEQRERYLGGTSSGATQGGAKGTGQGKRRGGISDETLAEAASDPARFSDAVPACGRDTGRWQAFLHIRIGLHAIRQPEAGSVVSSAFRKQLLGLLLRGSSSLQHLFREPGQRLGIKVPKGQFLRPVGHTFER